MWIEVGDESVTSLMDCRVDSISFCHAQLFTLDAHNDPVSGLVKVIHACLFFPVMNCLGDGRVNEVLNLCASEARRHRGEALRVNGLVPRDLAEVEAEDVLATIHVRSRHVDFLIETTWSHRCWVQGLLVIRCTNDHDLVILLEAIHFGQDLIQRRPARAAFRAAAAGPAKDTVDFIDEDEARLLFASFSEELLDSLSSHSDEHLIEIRPRAEDEVASSFAGDRPRQQRLARAGLTEEHDAFEELGTLVLVQFRVPDHLDDVLNFILDLVNTFNII